MINFIGIGAQKSATSWIYACLYEHPEICAPIKELHFFSRPRYEKGIAWYESHFAKCSSGTIKGEYSTSYLYSKDAAGRIAAHYPDIKILVSLRNPLARAYSQYRNAIKAGEISKEVPYETYLEQEKSVLEQGLYAEQIDRYLKYFKREQLHIIIYEDIEKDRAQVIRDLYSFLDVREDFLPPSLNDTTINTARTPRLVLLDRIMHHIAEALRKIGLDRLVWRIRKTGIVERVHAVNTESARTDSVDLSAPAHNFTDDAKRLSNLVDRDMVSEWNL